MNKSGLKDLIKECLAEDRTVPVAPRIYKSNWTQEQNYPGIYLVLPSSNSVWVGFSSKEEAETCLNVLPGWKLVIRK